MVVEDFKGENGDTKMAKKSRPKTEKVYVEKKPFYKRVWFIVQSSNYLLWDVLLV